MMNGQASGQRRGWIRVSHRIGEKAQRHLLERHGVRPVYNAKDHSLDDLISSLRPGDEVWVSTMGRLASRRAELRKAIDAIHKKKCAIVEAASERRSNRAAQAAQMALEAADELAHDARTLKPYQAKKFGQKGGLLNAIRIKREQEASRMKPAEA